MSATVEIVRTPDVLHGKPRIEGTRIGVFPLGAAVDQGATVADLCEGYPDLDRAQIEAALEYYEANPDEMDYIRTRKEAHKDAIAAQSRASV